MRCLFVIDMQNGFVTPGTCASDGGIESHKAGIKVLERLIGTEQLL